MSGRQPRAHRSAARKVPLLVVAACLITSLPGAQEQPRGEDPPGSPEQPGASRPAEVPASEQVLVNLVQVPLLAQDRQGRPVTDLTADEIRVKVGGERLEIAFLEPLAAALPDMPRPDVRLALTMPGEAAITTGPLDVALRYRVFFIDVQNDDPTRRSEVAEDVARTLVAAWQPGDRAAVFSYSGELQMEAGFTSQPESAAAAVRAAWGRVPRPALGLDIQTRQRLQRFEVCRSSGGGNVWDEGCLRGVLLEEVDQSRPEAESYLAALDRVVDYAAAAGRRASIVAFSHGVAADETVALAEALRALMGNTEQAARLQLEIATGETAAGRVEQLRERAIRAGVTVHVIDRNAMPPGIAGARQGRPLEPGFRPVAAAFEAPRFENEALAAWTGGVFRSGPDPADELEEVLDLEQGGYLLGYLTGERLSPRRLRKVKIDCTRRGVRLLHRPGAYREAAPLPDLPGGLLLGQALPPEPGAGGAWFVPFTIELSPTLPAPGQAGAESMATVTTISLRLEDVAGRDLAELFESVEVLGGTFDRSADLRRPLRLGGWLEAPAGRYRLTARVSRPGLGRSGEFTREFVLEGADAP